MGSAYRAVLASLAVLATASACEARPPVVPPPPAATVICKDAATPFSIETPAGFLLSPPQRGPDFDTYVLSRGATHYVGVYIGNFSQFNAQDHPEQIRKDRGSRRMMRVVSEGGRERVSEFLFETGCPSFPAQVHVWAFNVAGDQATADRLAASVRLK